MLRKANRVLLLQYVAAVNTRHRKDARRIFDQLWKEA
jgi:hypothetical protein